MLTCAELFIQALDEKDFSYTIKTFEDGDVAVDFPYEGKTTRCLFCGDEGRYLSLYCEFDNIPVNKTVDAIFVCNELNRKYKWVTFFLDEDNALMLHDDAILSEESATDEALELLLRIIKIGEEVKPVIMKAIYA